MSAESSVSHFPSLYLQADAELLLKKRPDSTAMLMGAGPQPAAELPAWTDITLKQGLAGSLRFSSSHLSPSTGLCQGESCWVPVLI